MNMQVDEAVEVVEGEETKHELAIVEGVIGKFDLEGYVSSYKGNTKVARLMLVVKRCPELAGEALKLVIEELQQGENTAQYLKIHDQHKAILASLGIAVDHGWISSADKQAEVSSLHRPFPPFFKTKLTVCFLDQVHQGKLENQLSQAQKGGQKEPTRLGHVNMGDFWFNRGDISTALKCYTRARDYCSTPEQTRLWCLNVIKCHVALEQYHSIASYVAKAENQESAERRGPVETAKLKVCSALAHLHSRGGTKDHKNFRFAAKAFTAVSAEIADNFCGVVSPRDVAVYGGLCALATLDRGELVSGVIKNTSFKQFLDKVPEIAELLNAFANSQYKTMFKHLDDLKPSLQLDLHLHKHVEVLCSLLRNRAMVQYFTPYSAVNLHAMAEAFGTDVPRLEKELAVLIAEGEISARIDSHNKVLKARSVNTRSSTFAKAIEVGIQHKKESEAMLLRASVLRHNMVVVAPKKESGGKRTNGGHAERSADLPAPSQAH